MIVREPVVRPTPQSKIQKVGQDALSLLAEVGKAVMICVGAFSNMRFMLTKRSRAEIIRQMYVCAVKNLPVITVVGFFIGMILSLQIGIELRRYNQ